MLNNAFGEDMIAVPVESQPLAAQLLQVAFRRLCSFGLQFSLEAEAAAVHFFPMSVSQEMALRGDGGTVESQVNSNHLTGFGDIRIRKGYHDMQPVLSVAGAQVSRRNLTTGILGAIGRNFERDAHPSCNRREANRQGRPIQRVGMNVVANCTTARARLSCLTPFLLAIKGAFQRLCCFDTGLNEQIAHQSRTGSFGLIVRGMMQPHTVLLTVLPAIGAHLIERLSELRERSIRCAPARMWSSVVSSRFSAYRKDTIYAKIMQAFEAIAACGQLSFLPCLKDRGSQKGNSMEDYNGH